MHCTAWKAATWAAITAFWVYSAAAANAPAAATPAAADRVANGAPAPAVVPEVARPAAESPSERESALASLPAGAREWSYALDGAAELELHTTAGRVRVVVGADDRVRVRGGHRDRDAAPEVRYRVRRGVGSLEIRGRDELDMIVEVPRALALAVRMSAGDLAIDRLDGDLDVRLRAGRVSIDAADTAAYADIDVSVVTGEIVWSAANVRHGGLFRSYDHSGPGAAKLRVRVLAGSIDIL